MTHYINTPNHTASIEVRNLGEKNRLLFCDFDPLAQERFMRELEAQFDVRQVTRHPLHNRPAACCIRVRLKADQMATFIDDLDAIFQDKYEY